MTRITNRRGDLQAESSEWLFKSPLAGGGGILWRPHYRPHSLFRIKAHNSYVGCTINHNTVIHGALILSVEAQWAPEMFPHPLRYGILRMWLSQTMLAI